MVAFLGPLLGALGGTQALGTLGAGLAGKSMLGQLLGGGLPNILSSLFGGSQAGGAQSGGNQQTNALLGDIKDMLSQLLEKDGECKKGGGHDCGGGETTRGGRGDDRMHGDCGDDKMRGGRGDDRMHGGRGDDDMRGGRGDDKMYGGCGDDDMRGGRGDDKMYGGCGDDDMRGGRGDDQLHGGHGHNHMNGGRGDDTYVIESGSDNVITDGRGKNDTVKLDGCQCDYDMERQGDDLILTNKEDGTRVVIKDQFAGKGGVDKLEFDDGTFDDFDSIEADDCGCEPTPPPCGDGHDDVRPLPYPVPMPHYGDHGGGEGGDGPGGDCGDNGNDSGDSCSV